MNVTLKVLVVSVLGTVSCGKTVTYDRTPTPSTITCVVNCEELPGAVKSAPSPYVQLEFTQKVTDHNKLLCTTGHLHGSGSPFSLGCNNAASPAKLVTSKLKNSGDCQKVAFKTTSDNPGNFDTTNYPGHYQICEQDGPMVWVDVENFNTGGIEDWNDAKIEVTNKSDSRALNWQWNNNKLFICVE